MKLRSFSIMILLILMSTTMGCSYYKVKRDDGTELKIISSREFPNGININYKSKEGSQLDIESGQVQNGIDSTILNLILRGIKAEDEAENKD
jgi:hypothetical protein